MSQYSEIMAELAGLREQNDWLVTAVKYLLRQGSGVEAEMPAGFDDEDLDLDEDDGTVVVPIHAPRAPKAKPCPHNRQGILDGKLVCIRC